MRARAAAVPTLLSVLGLTGCGGAGATSLASPPTGVPLVERDYELVEYGLTGESCQLSVLGIGIGDTSYASAIRRLRKQIRQPERGELQLVNVVEDSTFNFYLLAWEVCTIVSADLALLKEPAVEVQVRAEIQHTPAPAAPAPAPIAPPAPSRPTLVPTLP